MEADILIVETEGYAYAEGSARDNIDALIREAYRTLQGRAHTLTLVDTRTGRTWIRPDHARHWQIVKPQNRKG